jgi:hypothetical protein
MTGEDCYELPNRIDRIDQVSSAVTRQSCIWDAPN